MVDFGITLKTLRTQNNYTQVQLAQKFRSDKICDQRVRNWSALTFLRCFNIAKIFKVSTDYLLGMDNRQEIDLSGLTPEEITALKNLIKAMKHR